MKIILTSICSNLALTSLSERRLIVCWNFNICCSSRATSSMLRHRMFTPSDRYFSFLSLRLKVLILSSWTVLNRKPVTKYCSFKSYKTAVISAQNNTVYATKHHTHTRLTALCPGLPRWAGTRKVKPIWILLKQDSEWQWHQLGHMQICTSLQTNNHASTPPLSFYRAMLCIRGTSHGPVSVCVCHKPVFY